MRKDRISHKPSYLGIHPENGCPAELPVNAGPELPVHGEILDKIHEMPWAGGSRSEESRASADTGPLPPICLCNDRHSTIRRPSLKLQSSLGQVCARFSLGRRAQCVRRCMDHAALA